MIDPTQAVARLAVHYPQVDRAVIAGVLHEAYETVARVTGRADAGMAEDLAQLRLQIRAAVNAPPVRARAAG